MPRLVPVPAPKLIKILVSLGYKEIRIKGSHHFFTHPISGKNTSVPVHYGRIMKIGTLRAILRDIDLSIEKYDKLRLKI